MHGEHVDDHQLTIALDLGLRDLCVPRDADSLKTSDLQHAAAHGVSKMTQPALLDLVPRPRAPRDRVWA